MPIITNYLYPNRIQVITNTSTYQSEWNVVYRNRVKIYRGVDNVLTVEIKNPEQKRVDVSGMNLSMAITDATGILMTTVPLDTNEGIGIVSGILPALDLEGVPNQFLQFSVYQTHEDSTDTVLYADTYYGVKGDMELVGNAIADDYKPMRIDTYKSEVDINVTEPVFVSEPLRIARRNILFGEEYEALAFEINTSFIEAEVQIQVTSDDTLGMSTEWTTVELINIPTTTKYTHRLYPYPIINRDHKYMRLKYRQLSETGDFGYTTVTFERLENPILDGNSTLYTGSASGGWSND